MGVFTDTPPLRAVYSDSLAPRLQDVGLSLCQIFPVCFPLEGSGIRIYINIMPTVKELRKQAKSYGLRGYTTLRKLGLIRLIAEARAPEFTKRFQRAIKTRRYPALTRGDIENPHKRAQRCRELLQLNEAVNAALRAIKYEQQIKKRPEQRLAPLK